MPVLMAGQKMLKLEKAAADVRKTVRENNLKNTIEFLQKTKSTLVKML